MDNENTENKIELIFESNKENNIFENIKNNIKNKFKKFFIYSGIFVFLIILFFYFFIFRIPNRFPKGEILNIKENITLQALSKELENKNVIFSKVAFEVFMILYDGEKHIIPGDYLLEEKQYVFQIANRISKGDKNLAAIRLTIPEGFTNLEIADLAESKLNKFSKSNFLKNAQQGYMFPDTYFFLTTDTDEEVLNKMSQTFDSKIKDLKDDIAKSGKDEEDIIIMASIIEEEAKGDEDRAYISGILWNRIRIGMALQADAAPITYKERGLPNAPITNPGLEAIQASIYPKISPYLFYLHDKDGAIHYARNFTEHRRNIEKYLK